MERQQIFILMWTIANAFSFGALGFLTLAIMRSRKARAQKFNLYLVFSIMPDMLKNTLFFVMNVVNFVGFKPWACTAIGWGEVFYTCANYWMGAVVTHELHKMLVAMKRNVRISRTNTITYKRCVIQSVSVHIFAVAMASTVLETSVDWIPDVSIETQCEAFPTNKSEAYYFWFCYVFLGMMVPSIYLLYVCLDIYWNGLLPISGKTRFLALYFFRLIAIFVSFWIIFVVAVFLKGWIQAIAFVFFNMTGFFSFLFAVTKPDVGEACLDLLFCRAQRAVKEDQSGKFTTQNSLVMTPDSANISETFNVERGEGYQENNVGGLDEKVTGVDAEPIVRADAANDEES